jgi:hypothetical protein
MTANNEIDRLQAQLNSFSAAKRTQALAGLYERFKVGEVPQPEIQDALNAHAHSFFSYNAYGFSPSALAWLAKKNGYSMIGIVDFDTLDGVDEFLAACELLGVRGVSGMETRVFIPEFKEVEINSPGEPGVAYHMGTGFVSSHVPACIQPDLADIRQRAESRNRQILIKVNAFLSPLELDYEEDILPLTPGGYATERHMVFRIAEKADEVLEDPHGFWAEKLGRSRGEIEELLTDPKAFQNLLRKKLMKRGEVAYVQPDAGTFPTVDAFHAIVQGAGAIPCSAWLDGLSQGEQEMARLLDLLMEKGVRALNIVPDRNWNIKDPDLKRQKINELYQVVDLANALGLPVLVGTEMNSPGQKWVDDFDTPELEPVKDSFIKGANTLYGHTRMQRLWGLGATSAWAEDRFPDWRARNVFFERLGRLIPPGWTHQAVEGWVGADLTSAQVEERIQERLRETDE